MIVLRESARLTPLSHWAYPVVPIISVTAVLLIADLVFLAPETSGIGFLIVLTGIPVYLGWRKKAATDS